MGIALDSLCRVIMTPKVVTATATTPDHRQADMTAGSFRHVRSWKWAPDRIVCHRRRRQAATSSARSERQALANYRRGCLEGPQSGSSGRLGPAELTHAPDSGAALRTASRPSAISRRAMELEHAIWPTLTCHQGSWRIARELERHVRSWRRSNELTKRYIKPWRRASPVGLTHWSRATRAAHAAACPARPGSSTSGAGFVRRWTWMAVPRPSESRAILSADDALRARWRRYADPGQDGR